MRSIGEMNNLAYLPALHSVEGLGALRLRRLIDYFSDPKRVWEAESGELTGLGIPKNVVENLKKVRSGLDPLEYAQKITDAGIKVLTLYDGTYPRLLAELPDPPVVIYYKGEFSPKDQKALAIVGTRKMTGYGRTVTEKFASELSRKLTIVSGLARGVDTVAHRSAIASGGRTIAVLGGGLNRVFPPENEALAQKIAASFGVVMSEFPPDCVSRAGNFPARNRIVAGLSLGVLVTEAAEDSGSLITARLALDFNREVFAVPGPITSSLAKGPADLIKQGAKLVFENEDVLEELGFDPKVCGPAQDVDQTRLPELERLILTCIQDESKHIDELIRQLNRSSAEVSSSLLKLEILGLIKNLGGGVYSRTV